MMHAEPFPHLGRNPFLFQILCIYFSSVICSRSIRWKLTWLSIIFRVLYGSKGLYLNFVSFLDIHSDSLNWLIIMYSILLFTFSKYLISANVISFPISLIKSSHSFIWSIIGLICLQVKNICFSVSSFRLHSGHLVLFFLLPLWTPGPWFKAT